MYSFRRGLLKYNTFMNRLSIYRNRYPKTRDSQHGIRKIIYPHLDNGALDESVNLTEYYTDNVHHARKDIRHYLNKSTRLFEAIEQYYQSSYTKFDSRGINGIVAEFYLNDMNCIARQVKQKKQQVWQNNNDSYAPAKPSVFTIMGVEKLLSLKSVSYTIIYLYHNLFIQ